MLVISYPFLLAFLSATWLGFYLFGRFGKSAGAACSLFFYGWWDRRYLALLRGSICANYLAGGHLSRHAGTAALAGNRRQPRAAGSLQVRRLFLQSMAAATGADLPLVGVDLPIASPSSPSRRSRSSPTPTSANSLSTASSTTCCSPPTSRTSSPARCSTTRRWCRRSTRTVVPARTRLTSRSVSPS